MKDYVLLIIAAAFFSLQFMFQQNYQKIRGSGVNATFIFTLFTDGMIFLFTWIGQGFRLEFKWFSFLLCILAAANSILYVFCSLKALQKANLLLYSMYAMLGGMLLPLLTGFFIYREPVTSPIIASCILILAALILTLNLKTKGKSCRHYYVLVFLLNGMSGTLSKFHQSSHLAHVSSMGYLELKSTLSVIIVLTMLLITRRKISMLSMREWFCVGGNALLCGAGNLFMLIALLRVPASVQYPLVTGGVIIFSFLIDLLQKKCPSRNNLIAAGLALASTVIIIM